jgi:hypothetical protein
MILEKKLQKRPFEVTITSVATKPRATWQKYVIHNLQNIILSLSPWITMAKCYNFPLTSSVPNNGCT